MTSLNSYAPGNTVTLQGTFTDVATGALVDPTTIVCRTRDPAYNEVTYSGVAVARVSTGVYQTVVTPVLPGTWWYRFEGTGGVVAAAEFKFEVKPSIFTAA